MRSNERWLEAERKSRRSWTLRRAFRGVHGIPPRRLLWRYALPAAAPPLIPLCGLTIPALLSGSFLVEILFSWPGMGPLLYQATLARDLHVVVGATLVVAVCVILAQLAVDLLLFAADPRIADPRVDPRDAPL